MAPYSSTLAWKIPWMAQLLSHVPRLLKPMGPRACALQQEEPLLY